ncbi:hypothetical protein JTB14_019046 [Gonioctena quinquepunctata]|nr:hypothetical protein JTB14_019046 [Gonioctena quinquepunctata]
MTEITSSEPKCEEIKDCHVGQEDEIIIHQQDAAQVGDLEINQGIQDQQRNQKPTFKENYKGETSTKASRWYDFIPRLEKEIEPTGKESIKL